MTRAEDRIIAIEEHFMYEGLTDHFPARGPQAAAPHPRTGSNDLTEQRLKLMDDAGITMQVLSHQSPSAQRLDSSDAPEICREYE